MSDLDNVEKTFVGLKMEHYVRDMLDVPKGLRDLVIDGIDVDVKNTTQNTWMIPQETYRTEDAVLVIASEEHTLFTNAIRKAALTVDKAAKRRKLDLIAEKLVAKAIAGDNWCIDQVGDRLEGKPKERQEHAGLMDHAIRIIWPGMPAINGEASAPQIENTEPVAAARRWRSAS
jgi:hypothetical protein